MTKARTDQPATTDDLSESARAVVRDAGDPRIDAHLRALGLAPDSVDPVVGTAAAERVESPELVALRTRLGDVEHALAASGRRVQSLTVALAVAIITIVVLAALLVMQSA